jgi:hypothetical protein
MSKRGKERLTNLIIVAAIIVLWILVPLHASWAWRG